MYCIDNLYHYNVRDVLINLRLINLITKLETSFIYWPFNFDSDPTLWVGNSILFAQLCTVLLRSFRWFIFNLLFYRNDRLCYRMKKHRIRYANWKAIVATDPAALIFSTLRYPYSAKSTVISGCFSSSVLNGGFACSIVVRGVITIGTIIS